MKAKPFRNYVLAISAPIGYTADNICSFPHYRPLKTNPNDWGILLDTRIVIQPMWILSRPLSVYIRESALNAYTNKETAQ